MCDECQRRLENGDFASLFANPGTKPSPLFESMFKSNETQKDEDISQLTEGGRDMLGFVRGLAKLQMLPNAPTPTVQQTESVFQLFGCTEQDRTIILNIQVRDALKSIEGKPGAGVAKGVLTLLMDVRKAFTTH